MRGSAKVVGKFKLDLRETILEEFMSKVIITPESSIALGNLCRAGDLGSIITEGIPELTCDYTLLISRGVPLPDLGAIRGAFSYLEEWDLVVPLHPEEKLIEDLIKSERDREILLPIWGDLRVPAMDSRILYIRKSAWQLWTAFASLLEGGLSRDLALMGAVGKCHPFVLPLISEKLLGKAKRTLSPSSGVPTPHPKFRVLHRRGFSLVEIRPGQFVRCLEGEEEKTMKQWKERLDDEPRRQKHPAKQ